MTDLDARTDEHPPDRPVAPTTGRAEAPAPGTAGSEQGARLVETDLLVEEISIDGMCGVY